MNDSQAGLDEHFHNDEDLKFMAHSRAVKQLGFWVAESLGMTGDDAECYAQSLVEIDFDEPGIDNVFTKAKKDLSGHGKETSTEMLESIFREKFTTAQISVAQHA